ncbi:DUF423 domain-containing protein [Salinimicrobium gaetbulicola]|uniref:DUF423 domain-containing protein n=1 Tax=Salinimicrobium gaetbulicola TaxID=999702 RepID=A0ABW3IF54_9FLAO
MKNWNFKVTSGPKEMGEKLESSLGGVDRFVLNMNSDKRNTVRFKIRKRLSLPFEINTQNNLIVKGKILKGDAENETDVEVSFSHHPLAKLLIFGHIILGLSLFTGLFLKFASNTYMFIVGGLLLVIGSLLWIHMRRDFDKHVQEYKNLISGILE